MYQDQDTYFSALGHADEAEIQQLISQINLPALESQASRIRPGITCHISPLTYDPSTRNEVMGGMNFHIRIIFEDGVKWLARIRRTNATSPPPAIRDYIVRSEVASLHFLETVNIPTPKIMHYALEGAEANEVGVGYMLMEELPGKSLIWPRATKEQKCKVIDQLADFAIELQKHPFNKFGSLDQPGTDHVGPIAKEEVACMDGEEMHTSGPFSNIQEYYTHYLRSILDQILQKQRYTHWPIGAFLIHKFLLDVLPQVWTAGTANPQSEDCYLKHADDKGDLILVYSDYNITGTIDWEWAYTADAHLAFISPFILFNVLDFFNGSTVIFPHEAYFAECLERKGKPDMATWIRASRPRHFFNFCCGHGFEFDLKNFLGLFKGLRDAVGVDAGLE